MDFGCAGKRNAKKEMLKGREKTDCKPILFLQNKNMHTCFLAVQMAPGERGERGEGEGEEEDAHM